MSPDFINKFLNCSDKYKTHLERITTNIYRKFPKLKFGGKIIITSCSVINIMSLESKKIPDRELGQYIVSTNEIHINECCFKEYINGNKILIYKVLIHELIHASGIRDENETVAKTDKYINIINEDIPFSIRM